MGLFIISIFLFVSSCSATFKCRYPLDSIYQLGDSFLDTGNLLVITPTRPAGRPPYGETYFGRPNGRFCDGRLIIDFFAMELGLPFLKPYLDKNASFSGGVNFAVAGATAQDFSFFIARGVGLPNDSVPLGDQTTWFKQYLGSVCFSPAECSRRLSNSVLWLGEIGTNDLNYPFSQGKSIEEVRTYIPFIIDAIVKNARKVISLGVRRIIVPGNFPNGCFPTVLNVFSNTTTNGGEFDEFGCSKSYNNLTEGFNSDLQSALISLQMEYPNVSIVYADFYKAFRTMLIGAPIFGFNTGGSLLKACCGIGGPYNFNGIITCGSPGTPVCPDPQHYIHWDGLHLTEAAYRRISQILFPQIFPKIGCF